MAYLLFGLSAWWLLVIGARVWLGALARWLRRDDALAGAGAEPAVPAWRLWLGLVMLMSASCSLEWSRLYRQEAALAGEHAGGVLGYTLGHWSSTWLGFNGSGVFWIAVLVAGLSLALRFSWLDLAERIC